MTEPSAGSNTPPGRPYTIAAFVCAALALLLIPIVFGPVSIGLGVYAWNSKGDPLGRTAAIVGGVAMIIGFVLALILADQLNDFGP